MIICLCGSTRFKEHFAEANKQETLKGHIVLSVGFFGHHEPSFDHDSDVKQRLDWLHLEKIKMSDEVLFLNVGGYLGKSSLNELRFAFGLGKKIRFFEPNNLSDDVMKILGTV